MWATSLILVWYRSVLLCMDAIGNICAKYIELQSQLTNPNLNHSITQSCHRSCLLDLCVDRKNSQNIRKCTQVECLVHTFERWITQSHVLECFLNNSINIGDHLTNYNNYDSNPIAYTYNICSNKSSYFNARIILFILLTNSKSRYLSADFNSCHLF